MSSKEDLLFTLEICRNHLPNNVHPAHLERLREIERIVKNAFPMQQHEVDTILESFLRRYPAKS